MRTLSRSAKLTVAALGLAIPLLDARPAGAQAAAASASAPAAAAGIPAAQAAPPSAAPTDDDIWSHVKFGVTLEGYYQSDWNTPDDRVIPLRAYDTRANSFGLQQAALVVDAAPEADKGRRSFFPVRGGGTSGRQNTAVVGLVWWIGNKTGGW